jgi:long-subunit fatty acid transport protein
MGGLSVYSDSISINLTNPAAYSELKLVNYSVGINYSNINLKSENSNEKATTASINYLSVAVPTKHFVFGFGIIPKSSVGYLLESNDDSKIPNEINRYEGNGGVNTTFLTMGFKILKKIRFGISANYDFGSLEHSNSRFLDGVELYTRVQSNSSLSGLSFDYSLLFREEISKNITIHATYGIKPSSKLSSNNSQILSTIPVNGGYGGDSEDIDLTALNLDKTKILIPAQTTFGFGIGKDTKWFIGMDYSYGGAGGYENKLFNLENVEYKKASKFAIGGLFVPSYNSFTSYVSRIVYRAGIRIEKSGLHIQDQSINEYGINFGIGLPFQGFQNLNLGVEIGKRGTKKGGLIEENFVSFRLGISLNDRWFVKNKYN